ncbi:hypothetical protein PQY76_00515, partial [bacterium]|nr:hypothetical protein [bacterium]
MLAARTKASFSALFSSSFSSSSSSSSLLLLRRRRRLLLSKDTMISSSLSSSNSPLRQNTPGLFRVVDTVRASSSTRRTARFRGGSFFGAFLSSSSSEQPFPRLLRRLSRGAKSSSSG